MTGCGFCRIRRAETFHDRDQIISFRPVSFKITTFANSEMLSQLGSFRHMTQSLHLPVLRLN